MKVKIGNYRRWIGPYQIAEALCFWVKDVKDEHGIKSKPDWVHNFGEFLAHGFHKDNPEQKKRWITKDRPTTLLYKFCSWIHSKQKRHISIKIDRWDSWNAEHTLSLIAVPLLKQLQAKKHGAPLVDDEDVPEGLGLRSSEAPAKENEWDVDENHFKRWDWVLDEIIWAHEQIIDEDNDKQFYSGKHDLIWEPDGELDDKGKPKMYRMERGPNDTFKVDEEGLKAHQERIRRGLIFFGKYYQNLWD